MITIEGLEFRYPEGEFRLAVDSLAVERGAAAAVIGPSGSGKTTLLRLIAGILAPDRGRVVTNGIDLSGLDDGERRDFRLRDVGMVFQEFALLEYLNVLDNVLLPLRLARGASLQRSAREHARELVARIGLADKLGSLPAHLSQGERQRVAICRAMVTRPPLLLADEPTGNLDPRTKGRVVDDLLAFAGEAGATLVFVTHDHGLLDRFEQVVDFEALNTAGAAEAGTP